ncbi:hypothetical protein Pla100_60230 [Neorhodopirellula pilleata]|uniref:Uncharacterized protein n=1 Tax=Neorhodopirellula pilleata TaxID=2714738 RepID=A0A5C5ZGI9_9BACT|nr:hypothetical protein Pla100_60230 [Neorhodopirellula pilleata]
MPLFNPAVNVHAMLAFVSALGSSASEHHASLDADVQTVSATATDHRSTLTP